MGSALVFGLFFWLFFVGFALAIYFLPTIFAVVLRRRNALLVAVVNTLLGWSFVGWVVALVMALAKESEPVPVVHIHQQIAYPQTTYEESPPQTPRRVPGSSIEPR
jgi:hypothetical protein